MVRYRIKRAWINARRHMVNRPYDVIAYLTGFLLGGYGLYELAKSIFSEFGIVAGVLLSGLFIITFTLIIVIHMENNLSDAYKLDQYTNYIYGNVLQHWELNENGSRNVYCEKDYVFYRSPGPDDLVDTLFGSLGLDAGLLNYTTDDATIENYIQATAEAINVSWKPKYSEIHIGEPYTHSFSYTYPSGSDRYRKSFTIASRVNARNVSVIVETHFPIIEAIFKRNDDLVGFTDYDKIAAAEGAILPLKAMGRYRVEACAEDLEPGQSYFLLIKMEPSANA